MINRISRSIGGAYDSLGHSLLGSLMCFEVKETNRISYGIILRDSKELVLIDPVEELIPEFLAFMDQEDLKFRSFILTGKMDDFHNFYKDLNGIGNAFSDRFEIFGAFGYSTILTNQTAGGWYKKS